MDRARRARSGTTVGIVVDTKESNPFGYYWGFWVICVVLGDFRVMMGTKVDVFRLEWIELVELDPKPLLESCCMLKRRIRLGFLGDLGGFRRFKR